MHKDGKTTDRNRFRGFCAAWIEGNKCLALIDRFHGVVDDFRIVALVGKEGAFLQRNRLIRGREDLSGDGRIGKKNRGCTKYKTVPDDYRLSIDRSCLYFKRTYALRTECERYNSRFKSTGQERLWVRNGASAANLNTLAHISALAVALAAVLHGSQGRKNHSTVNPAPAKGMEKADQAERRSCLAER